MKRFVPLVVILGLLGLSGCSGDSPSAPPVPTVVPEAWAITSISVSDTNPLLGNVVLVLVEVTRNGSAAPDGTNVRLTASGGGIFSCATGEVVPGVTEANVAIQDGVACAQFVALEPGAYAINATVNAVTRQVQVVYQSYDPTDALQIFQPVLPNRGPYDGGQPMTLRGKGIVAPVDVIFSVDDTTGTKQVVQYPAIVQSVVESNPPSATGTIEIITPFISHVRDEERIERPADITVTVAVGTGGEQQEVLTEAYTYEDEQDPPLPEDSAQWRVTGTPLIYIVQPDAGPSAGGNTVTIIGNHFAAILLTPEGQILDRRSIVDRVLFNNLEGIVQQVSSDGQQIQVTVPRFSTTPLTDDLPVTVTVEFTSDIDSDNGFPDGVPDVDVNFDGDPDATIPTASRQNAYVVLADEPQPDVVSLSPSSGPVDGGTQVTLYGSGFQMPLEVRFGTLTARDVELFDDTSLADDDVITCVTPDYSQQDEDEIPITVDVRVTNLRTGKDDTLTGGFTYGDNLYITGNTPVTGGPGTTVVIFGAGFEDPLTVDFTCGAGCGEEPRLEVISVSGTELLVRFPLDWPVSCEDVQGEFLVTLLESALTTQGGGFRFVGNNPEILYAQPATIQQDQIPNEVTIYGRGFTGDLIVEILAPPLNQVYRFPSSDVQVVDPNTIVLSNFPNPGQLPTDNVWINWDHISCVTDIGTAGTRSGPTPLTLRITNFPGNCSSVDVGGMVVYPDYNNPNRNTEHACAEEVVPPSLIAPLSIQFDPTQQGSSDCRQFTISNNSPSNLIVEGLNTLAPNFGENVDCTDKSWSNFQVGPFATSVPQDVCYCPQDNDGQSDLGTLTIISNDPGSPTQVTLQGQEAFPIMSVAPQALNFVAPYPSQQVFTITNSGTADLHYTVSGSAAPFSIASGGSGTIAPMGSADVTVQTTASGAAVLTVTANPATDPDAQGSPIDVSLTAP